MISKKKVLKKVLSIMLVMSMIFSLAACGKDSSSEKADGQDQGKAEVTPGGDSQGSDETEYTGDIELLVDLHGWMPTLNTEPTAENPTVFRSPQDIADKFNELYPNITIKWARNKPVGGLQSELAEWFTTQINAGTVPAIAFSWGTQYQDRDWYLSLDEYLDTPNEFVEGNTKWRDLFPEYLWSSSTIANANKEVVAVPIALYPGPATGYFYNKTAFEAAGLTEAPVTWEELLTASKKMKEAGYTGISPTSILPNIQFGAWVQQFSIGPYLAAGIMDEADYDGDSRIDSSDQVRGVKAGLYNPVDKEYAQELFKQIKRYYTEVLEFGWESTDYTTAWNEGKVGFREDGMWILQSENSNKTRSFDFGVFPAPLYSIS